MSQGEHSNIGTIFFAVGFSVMMVLDVALGQRTISVYQNAAAGKQYSGEPERAKGYYEMRDCCEEQKQH